MSRSAAQQLRTLQQALYESAYKEAHDLVASSSQSIATYSVKFAQSLPKRVKPSTQADLISAIRSNDVVLYGDFHTLRQSQRGLLRIIRTYVERHKTKKLILALEMFKHVDQDFLDAYCQGRIGEQELLDSVNYLSTWGFPWKNFKMLLDYARLHKFKVIGINSDNAGRDSLHARDNFAARIIVDKLKENPNHKVICLIGEYHLADSHLPRAIERRSRELGREAPVLRIVNNVDQYYFSKVLSTRHLSTEYLRLRKDFYCIMNTPPWMKWRSYSLWEELRELGGMIEGEPEQSFENDLDLYTEDQFDIDYHFVSFVRNLLNFFDIRVESSDIESFQVCYSPDSNFLPLLMDEYGYKRPEAARIIARASADGVYFLTHKNTVLLTSISINNLAEAAGQFILTMRRGFVDSAESHSESFMRRVIKEAMGMIASKILNPRRKCLELHHFRTLLRRQTPLRRSAHARVAAGVLRFDAWVHFQIAADIGQFTQPPVGIIRADLRHNFEISRMVGQMLGFNLYKKMVANKVPSDRIRRLVSKKMSSPDDVWRELRNLFQLLTKDS